MKVTGGRIGHNLPRNLQDFKGGYVEKSAPNRKGGVI